MPPGLPPTAFLDRLGEYVPTYRLGLEGLQRIKPPDAVTLV